MEAFRVDSTRQISKPKTISHSRKLVPPSRTWKMQGWWFSLYFPSTLLSGQCRRQMDHGEWHWLLKTQSDCDSDSSCCTRCGVLTRTNKHISWYMICIYWSSKCLFWCLSIRIINNEMLRVGKTRSIALQSYLKDILTLQHCVVTQFEGVLIAYLSHKVSHWSTMF